MAAAETDCMHTYLYVCGHVVAGLVLAQWRDAARVEDVLTDERTWQAPADDESFLLGAGGGAWWLEGDWRACHRHSRPGSRCSHWRLSVMMMMMLLLWVCSDDDRLRSVVASCLHHSHLLSSSFHGSHSFTDRKKSGTFPGLSRTPMNNFPGPFRSLQMSKWRKNGIYLQYSECSPLQKIQHEAKCAR